MNGFEDWLTRTKVVIIFDSFFRKSISVVSLPFIAVINQPQNLFMYVDTDAFNSGIRVNNYTARRFHMDHIEHFHSQSAIQFLYSRFHVIFQGAVPMFVVMFANRFPNLEYWAENLRSQIDNL